MCSVLLHLQTLGETPCVVAGAAFGDQKQQGKSPDTLEDRPGDPGPKNLPEMQAGSLGRPCEPALPRLFMTSAAAAATGDLKTPAKASKETSSLGCDLAEQ